MRASGAVGTFECVEQRAFVESVAKKRLVFKIPPITGSNAMRKSQEPLTESQTSSRTVHKNQSVRIQSLGDNKRAKSLMICKYGLLVLR
jgi:hypothetical protein